MESWGSHFPVFVPLKRPLKMMIISGERTEALKDLRSRVETVRWNCSGRGEWSWAENMCFVEPPRVYGEIGDGNSQGASPKLCPQIIPHNFFWLNPPWRLPLIVVFLRLGGYPLLIHLYVWVKTPCISMYSWLSRVSWFPMIVQVVVGCTSALHYMLYLLYI